MRKEAIKGTKPLTGFPGLKLDTSHGPIKHIVIIGYGCNVEFIEKALLESASSYALIDLNAVNNTGFFDTFLESEVSNFYKWYGAVLKLINDKCDLSDQISLICYAHGNVGNDSQHKLHYLCLTNKLELPTYCLLEMSLTRLKLNSSNSTVHIHSCFGGQVVVDLKHHLPELSIGVVTHATDSNKVKARDVDKWVVAQIHQSRGSKWHGELATLYDFLAAAVSGIDFVTSYYIKAEDGTTANKGSVQSLICQPAQLKQRLIDQCMTVMPVHYDSKSSELDPKHIITEQPDGWEQQYLRNGLDLAMARNDQTAVNEYIALDAAYTMNNYGESSIMVALLENRPDYVKQLLDLGHDPNVGYCLLDLVPLTYCLTKKAEMIKCYSVLLDSPKLNINALSQFGYTVLMRLVSSQKSDFWNLEYLRLFLTKAHGVDMEYANELGETALMMAKRVHGATSTYIDLLLDFGAKPIQKSTLPRRCYISNDGFEDFWTCKLTLKKVKERYVDEYDCHSQGAVDLLHALIQNANIEGRYKMVEYLLQICVDPNVADRDITALGIAAYNNDAKMVELLLKYKANPNIRTTNQLSPLIEAAKLGNARVVAALLEDTRTRIELKDATGKTAKQNAEACQKSDVIKLFCDTEESSQSQVWVSDQQPSIEELQMTADKIRVAYEFEFYQTGLNRESTRGLFELIKPRLSDIVKSIYELETILDTLGEDYHREVCVVLMPNIRGYLDKLMSYSRPQMSHRVFSKLSEDAKVLCSDLISDYAPELVATEANDTEAEEIVLRNQRVDQALSSWVYNLAASTISYSWSIATTLLNKLGWLATERHTENTDFNEGKPEDVYDRGESADQKEEQNEIVSIANMIRQAREYFLKSRSLNVEQKRMLYQNIRPRIERLCVDLHELEVMVKAVDPQDQTDLIMRFESKLPSLIEAQVTSKNLKIFKIAVAVNFETCERLKYQLSHIGFNYQNHHREFLGNYTYLNTEEKITAWRGIMNLYGADCEIIKEFMLDFVDLKCIIDAASSAECEALASSLFQNQHLLGRLTNAASEEITSLRESIDEGDHNKLELLRKITPILGAGTSSPWNSSVWSSHDRSINARVSGEEFTPTAP